MGVELHTHPALRIEHQNIAVHAVLGPVGCKPCAQGGHIGGCTLQKTDNLAVGGQKAHIGGALVQVALDDIHDHLGHGRHFAHGFFKQLFGQHAGHVRTQLTKGIARFKNEIEQGGGNGVAVDFSRQGYPRPLPFKLRKNRVTPPDIRHELYQLLNGICSGRMGLAHNYLIHASLSAATQFQKNSQLIIKYRLQLHN